MPKLSEDHEIAVRRAIRDAIAIDPLISLRALQKVVEKRLNRTVEYHYLSRLVKKVRGELAIRIDKEKIAPRIGIMREDFRLARENLLRIAYADLTADKDKIAAWKAIGMLSKILLDAEMDLGLFERQGPTDSDFRSRPLPPEMFDSIALTFTQWRLPDQGLTRKIEPKAPMPIVAAPPSTKPPETPPEASKEEKKPLPKGLIHNNASIKFEPQPDGTLKRVERVVVSPTQLIPADPEFRVS